MKRTLTGLVLIVSSVAFARTSAQTTTTDSPGSFVSGLGSEAIGFRDGSKFTPAGLAQFGYEKHFDGSLFSLRFEGSAYQNSHDGLGSSNRLRSFGLALTPIYSFSSGSTRPYVLGSVGVERFSGAHYRDLISTDESSPKLTTLDRGSAASMSLGGGLLRQLGGKWYFAEVRGEVFSGPLRFQRFRIPVTFGVRF